MADFRFAGACSALALMLATPVFAQTGDSPSAMAGRSGSQSQASRPMAQGAADSAKDMDMSCQSMIDKASDKGAMMADGAKKTDAMKQISMAKKSLTAGDDKMCKTHVRSAMDDMSML